MHSRLRGRKDARFVACRPTTKALVITPKTNCGKFGLSILLACMLVGSKVTSGFLLYPTIVGYELAGLIEPQLYEGLESKDCRSCRIHQAMSQNYFSHETSFEPCTSLPFGINQI